MPVRFFLGSGCGTRTTSFDLLSMVVPFYSGRTELISVSKAIPAEVPPGRYSIYAEVDPEDRFRESDETNNLRACLGSIDVRGPAKAEPPASIYRSEGLALRRGLGLLSIPVDPSTAGALDARDLVSLTGASMVVATTSDAAGNSRFVVFGPGLHTPPFLLQGGESYLVLRQGPAVQLEVTGRRWPRELLRRRLGRGVNLLSYPRGVPAGETASTLMRRTRADFVAQLDPSTGRLQPYLPGLSPDYPIRPDRGYLISIPAPSDLIFPSCEN